MANRLAYDLRGKTLTCDSRPHECDALAGRQGSRDGHSRMPSGNRVGGSEGSNLVFPRWGVREMREEPWIALSGRIPTCVQGMLNWTNALAGIEDER